MTRRGAQNPRYQKGNEGGKTRKSAASAKPKRPKGGEARSNKSSESAPKKRWFDPLPVPDTPEFRRWRRIWLGLLVAALVFSLGAWWGQNNLTGSVNTISLVAAYSCIFGALYIDITKIRRMRKQYAKELAEGTSKSPKKTKDDTKSKND